MSMHESYEHYFSTRHYTDRYPRPNVLTLERVLSIASPGATLLDIGAGNGRYAVPLAERGYRIIAVEPCDAAREQLAQAAAARQAGSRISYFKTLADVDDDLLGSAELALFLFGVLGHMRYDERRATLGRLRDGMGPRAEAIGSVPNRSRRFRGEQVRSPIDDGGRAPRFSYSRPFGGVSNTFEYTAFSPAEFRDEVAALGWTCADVRAESLLDESAVTRLRVLGALDARVCRRAPASLGYDILFHITATKEPATAHDRHRSGLPAGARHCL